MRVGQDGTPNPVGLTGGDAARTTGALVGELVGPGDSPLVRSTHPTLLRMFRGQVVVGG
jgi:hypothetical protein